jgi:hypothetical protein
MPTLNKKGPHQPLDLSYDYPADVLTIEGIRYSGNLFRAWAKTFPVNQPFELKNRMNDCLTITTHYCKHSAEKVR